MTLDVDSDSHCERDNEPEEQKEIEVTPEMIEAAAKVLWAEPSLEAGMTMGWAADIATRMLRHALALCPDQKDRSE